MATDRNQNRTRSRWGMCLNDACERSKNHERIEITGRKDFVCPDCGKPLKECPPPPVPKPWGKYAAVAAAVLVLGGGGYWGYTQLGSDKDKQADADTTAVDTAKVRTPEADTTKVQPQHPDTTAIAPTNGADTQDHSGKVEEDAQTKQGHGGKGQSGVNNGGSTKTPSAKVPLSDQKYGSNVRVSYGTYTGELRNGKPHGIGEVRFSTTHRFGSGEVAQPGDVFKGSFRDGRISGGSGKWIHDGQPTVVMP